MAYEVFNIETGDSHGTYETLGEARGCVEFDRLSQYEIWAGEELIEWYGSCAGDGHADPLYDPIYSDY